MLSVILCIVTIWMVMMGCLLAWRVQELAERRKRAELTAEILVLRARLERLTTRGKR
jgi:hypothetical protein